MLVNDIDLETSVTEALDLDSHVDARHIAISAETGAVTLAGYVPTFLAKFHAVKTAEGVFGVRAIADELEVHLQKPSVNDDSAIAQLIARILESNIDVAKYKLKMKVANGHVTLAGRVRWAKERNDAERAVAAIPGVLFVLNDIVVEPRVSSTEVRSQVATALTRRGSHDADHVHVSISGGTAVLSGHVHSLGEARVAKTAAACAPGVTSVEDHLCIVR